MKTIELPYMTLQLDENGGGEIVSRLRAEDDDPDFNNILDGLESLILAHACSGVDIESAEYIIGIETALEAIANNA
jgi:hypothetical protein